MARTPRSRSAVLGGRRLGRILREARLAIDPPPAPTAVAYRAKISVDALRKIEAGTVADPGFFTVMRIARQVGLTSAELERLVSRKTAT